MEMGIPGVVGRVRYDPRFIACLFQKEEMALTVFQFCNLANVPACFVAVVESWRYL